MFSDYVPEATEFSSTWKKHKRHCESGSQTSEILTYEVHTQSHRPRHAECQTESLLDLLDSKGIMQNTRVDEERLTHFLLGVEPMISKQLKINNSAVNLYSGIFKTKYGSVENIITCEHVLDEETLTKTEGDEMAEVTCISWTKSGASVVAAYGTNESIAWSEGRSFVCLWNLDRQRLDPNKCDQKLELESSVQVIACHPQYAGYIAAGLHSGNVVVWDLAKDEVSSGEIAHADPVTSLCWMEHEHPKFLKLLSTSTDGSLILWNLKKGKGSPSIQMEKSFKITAAHLPRRTGVKGHGAVGITCSCLVPDVEYHDNRQSGIVTSGNLAVGCENGIVLKCSLDGADPNPVTFAYEGHVGPVYSIDWSPFHRHLFLTCSTDQTCRIYHALQAAPLRQIRPEEAVGGRAVNYLYSAFWSRTKPTLFYAAGSRGRVEACDVRTSRCVSFCDVTGRDGKSCAVNHMRYNAKRPRIFATGSTVIHVWRLGAGLVEMDDNEREEIKALDVIANEAMTDD